MFLSDCVFFLLLLCHRCRLARSSFINRPDCTAVFVARPTERASMAQGLFFGGSGCRAVAHAHPAGSKNALGPVGIPLLGRLRRRAINPTLPKEVKAWREGPLRPPRLHCHPPMVTSHVLFLFPAGHLDEKCAKLPVCCRHDGLLSAHFVKLWRFGTRMNTLSCVEERLAEYNLTREKSFVVLKFYIKNPNFFYCLESNFHQCRNHRLEKCNCLSH